jgi:hypothetical protein
MARFIPVGGEPQEETPLYELLLRFANNGRMVNFLHLEGEQSIAYHPDAREINKVASQLANGTQLHEEHDGVIYGDAIIFLDAERLG